MENVSNTFVCRILLFHVSTSHSKVKFVFLFPSGGVFFAYLLYKSSITKIHNSNIILFIWSNANRSLKYTSSLNCVLMWKYNVEKKNTSNVHSKSYIAFSPFFSLKREKDVWNKESKNLAKNWQKELEATFSFQLENSWLCTVHLHIVFLNNVLLQMIIQWDY